MDEDEELQDMQAVGDAQAEAEAMADFDQNYNAPDEAAPEGEPAGVTAVFNRARHERQLSRAGVLRLLQADSLEACMQARGYPLGKQGLAQLWDYLAFKVDQAEARRRGGEEEDETEPADEAQQVAAF